MKTSATEHYRARHGNCAQCVALAWSEKDEPSAPHADHFANAGGGKAPDGLCGALFAARELAGEAHQNELTERFKNRADGQTTCRAIRSNRIMPCADCVALAAELLEEITQ